MDSLLLVKEFQEKFFLPVLSEPQIPSDERCKLRINLIEEELKEFAEAIEQKNVAEVLDALCDLKYVVDGAALEFGLGGVFNDAFKDVHMSNMSKSCKNLLEAEETKKHYDKIGQKCSIKKVKTGNEIYFLVLRDEDKKLLKSIYYKKANPKSIVDSFLRYSDMKPGTYYWVKVYEKDPRFIPGILILSESGSIPLFKIIGSSNPIQVNKVYSFQLMDEK